MTAAVWPTGDLAFYAERGSWQEKPDQNVARFAPEVGVEKTRPRSYFATVPASVKFTMRMTSAELELFEAFYITTLASGSLTFTADDPRLGANRTFRFDGEGYSVRDAGYDSWTVSLTLKRLPI